jgi:dihydroflavonol-4-reductase
MTEAHVAETVLVTGGTGFVGGWCIVELLKRGYAVRTTVRSAAREAAVRAAVVRGLVGEVSEGAAQDSVRGPVQDRVAVVVADLTADAGWAEAVGGCAYVLHVASPLGGEVGAGSDADALVAPAREGALRVLRAAVQAGVKRVVLTSSCGAATPAVMGVDTVSAEEVWSDAERQDPYRRSKTLAERAAWEFMGAEGGAMQMTAVLPSGVFGPVLSKEGLGSVQFIQRMVDGRLRRIPNVGLNIIDVRDLAVAHVDAMTAPGAAGQRLIVSGDFMWMKDIAAVLRAKLGARGGKIPTKELPDFVVRIGANFSTALNTLKPLLRRSHRFSSDKARRVIGLSTRPAAETVIDSAESLLAA